ncbi:MAG: hypothetical protein V2B19_29785 [Pseudomonadota bacterium]
MITESKGKFHIVTYEFNALPKTTYYIDIITSSLDAEIRLIVDIYAEGFDSPDQEKMLPIPNNRFRPITIRLYSGDAPPRNVLRFMYSSELPVNFAFKIGKISFQKKPIRFIENSLKGALVIFLLFGIGLTVTSAAGHRFLAICESTVEQHPFCLIIILYFVISLLRFTMISCLPSWSGDEYVYKTLANSYWLYNDFFKITPEQVSTHTAVPNLLYPYIISPAFYFGDAFYSWIRLINCLVFSLSILPVYLLAINYVDPFKSIVIATLTLLIPWGNISAYAVTEVLYFPCFLFCVLFLHQAMKSLRIGHVAALSLFCALLVSTRPTGYIIAVTALMLLLFHSAIVHGKSVIHTAGLFFVFSIGFLLVLLSINLLLIDRYLPELGIYRTAVLDINTSVMDICLTHRYGVAKLVLGHVGIFGLIYILSISASLTRIANAIRNRRHREPMDDPLLILTWALFSATLLATFLFTIKVSATDLGGLERWHGRYYFFTFPLFFIEAVRAISEKTTTQFRKFLIFTALFLLSINFYFYLYEKALHFEWFGSLADNMDAQWYKHLPWLYPYVIAIIGFSLFFLVRMNTAFAAWISGTILLLGIANVGTWVEARIFSADDLRCSKLIQGLLRPTELNHTAIYAQDLSGIVNPLFWLTKDLALAVQTGGNSIVNASDIPHHIKFVITRDPVKISFPVSKSTRCGECEVHMLY